RQGDRGQSAGLGAAEGAVRHLRRHEERRQDRRSDVRQEGGEQAWPGADAPVRLPAAREKEEVTPAVKRTLLSCLITAVAIGTLLFLALPVIAIFAPTAPAPLCDPLSTPCLRG